MLRQNMVAQDSYRMSFAAGYKQGREQATGNKGHKKIKPRLGGKAGFRREIAIKAGVFREHSRAAQRKT